GVRREAPLRPLQGRAVERRIIVIDQGAAEAAVLALEIAFIEAQTARQGKAEPLDQVVALIARFGDEAAKARQGRLLGPEMWAGRIGARMLGRAHGKFPREI